MSDNKFWKAVAERDARYDGAFVYAVRSTGIYCRPSCPSRRPRREQVIFFAMPDAAEEAGFRACRRCHPREHLMHPDAALLERACRALVSESKIEAVAADLGVTPARLRAAFRRVLGITPREFAGQRKMAAFQSEIRQGRGVTDALYEAGYGSSSRLYERAATHLGMTPGVYRKGGRGESIAYTTVACSLGTLLVARTERGICAVTLGSDAAALASALREQYPQARLAKDDGLLRDWVSAIVHHLAGRQTALDLPLDLQATAFQQRVWEALRRIPYGETRSYSEVAAAVGAPNAARAVARACATNPAALVIPCHRVVRNDGARGGYRWGIERKNQILDTEAECSRKNSQ